MACRHIGARFGWFAVGSSFAGKVRHHEARPREGNHRPVSPNQSPQLIFLDEKGTDGQTHRWAVEGPSILQLKRTGFAKDVLKPGDAIEVCGYVPKETITWQIASADTTSTSLAGRLINAESLVMPDGKQQKWGDYGVHKCFESGYTDQHSSR